MNDLTKELARVNGVSILVIENGDGYVPIKPICEALGVDPDSQRKKIMSDEILSPTTVLSTAVGADGKRREMFSIPYQYVFGWLFTINPKNVKEEARENMIKYKQICYEVLFKYFADISKFLKEKEWLVSQKVEEEKVLRKNFYRARKDLSNVRLELEAASNMTMEQWQEEQKQLSLDFGEEEIEEY